MNRENAKLVLDGNAFYEIDLACLRAKEKQKIQEQTEKISNQTIEIERLQKRLLGLEGSKLMRFQRKYWRIRKKVKRIVPWTLMELKNKKRDWWS